MASTTAVTPPTNDAAATREANASRSWFRRRSNGNNNNNNNNPDTTPTMVFPAETEPEPSPCLASLHRFVCRPLRKVIRIVTYPLVVLSTTVSLIVLLVICVLPTLVGLSVGICLYYCVMEDPMPLSLMIRYMLAPDPHDTTGAATFDDNGNPNYGYGYGESQSRSVLEKKLIVRTLLDIQDHQPSPTSVAGEEDSKKKRKWSLKKQQHTTKHATLDGASSPSLKKDPSPISIYTHHKKLMFSEPVVFGENDTEDNATNIVPNYQQSGGAGIDLEMGRINTVNTPTTMMDHDDPPPRNSSMQDEDDNDSPAEEGEEPMSVVPEDQNDSNDEEAPPEPMSSPPPSSPPSSPQAADETTTIRKESDASDNNEMICSAIPVEDTPTLPEDDHANNNDVAAAPDYFGIQTTNDDRERGTSCDICLLEYEVGDQVAWSPNKACSHAYHKDCILDWLVRKPTCPNCRQDYLKSSSRR